MARLNRLFFALTPEAALQHAMADAAHRLAVRLQPGGHAVASERLHLTLAFLGDAVPAVDEAAALAAGAQVAAAPFELVLDQAGSFPGRAGPWWLGPCATPAGLEHLHRSLHDALLRQRVPLDRKRFVAHVTVRRDARMRLAPTRIEPLRWPVQHFGLLRSAIGAGMGNAYELLAQWPLRASGRQAQLDLLA